MEKEHEKLAIENLLSQVSLIVKKYDEIATITGENFNVFKILKLSTKEVQTHSAFIAELLNSKGSHGMKDVFLRKFIKLQKEKFREKEKFLQKFECFDTEHASVSTEENIGLINRETIEGGRIDIVVKDNAGCAIIFENKIYAGDEEFQLTRYRKAYKVAPIFYLTLDGKEPSDDSKGNLINGVDFVCISYQGEIIQWLNECLSQAVSYPLLRETMSQYINLIKYLTGQTMNENIRTEIANIIVSKHNDESLKAFFEISKSDVLQSVRRNLIQKFKVQLEMLAEKLQLEIKYDGDFGFSKDSDIDFLLNNSVKGYYLSIGFSETLNFFTYGLSCKLENVEEYKTTLCSNLNKGLDGYKNWIWISEFESPYNNWSKMNEPWLSIKNENLVQLVEKKFRFFLKLINQLIDENEIHI